MAYMVDGDKETWVLPPAVPLTSHIIYLGLIFPNIKTKGLVLNDCKNLYDFVNSDGDHF